MVNWFVDGFLVSLGPGVVGGCNENDLIACPLEVAVNVAFSCSFAAKKKKKSFTLV